MYKRQLLKIAYRDKWLRENINDYLDKDVDKRQDLLCIVRFVCESHYCKDDKGDEERGDGGDHHIADMAE